MARTVEHDRDKPFWLSLAMSWLQLAEHRSRTNASHEGRVAEPY
jgi:hypothetical protein